MPKCKKCGASLHPEQKVCLDCGTQTELWPGGATEEEKPPLQIPWTPVGIIAGGLVALIVLISVAMHFRVAPPDEVVNKWLAAVTSRSITKAKEYTTPAFESATLGQTQSAQKADDYQLFIYNNEADYSVSKPTYNPPNRSGTAVVTVTLTGKNGQSLVEQIRLVREKRAWKITMVE